MLNLNKMWRDCSTYGASNGSNPRQSEPNRSFHNHEYIPAPFCRLDSVGDEVYTGNQSKMPPDNFRTPYNSSRQRNYSTQSSVNTRLDTNLHEKIHRSASVPDNLLQRNRMVNGHSTSAINKLNNCVRKSISSTQYPGITAVQSLMMMPIKIPTSAEVVPARLVPGWMTTGKGGFGAQSNIGSIYSAVVSYASSGGNLFGVTTVPSVYTTMSYGTFMPMTTTVISSTCAPKINSDVGGSVPNVNCPGKVVTVSAKMTNGSKTDEITTNSCCKSKNDDTMPKNDVIKVSKSESPSDVIKTSKNDSAKNDKQSQNCKRNRKKNVCNETTTEYYENEVNSKKQKDKKTSRKSKSKQQNPGKSQNGVSNCDKNVIKVVKHSDGLENKSEKKMKRSKLKHLNRDAKYQCNNFSQVDSEDVFTSSSHIKQKDKHGDIRKTLREGYLQSKLEENKNKTEKTEKHDDEFVIEFEEIVSPRKTPEKHEKQSGENSNCAKSLDFSNSVSLFGVINSDSLDIPRSFSMSMTLSDSDWDDNDSITSEVINDADLSCFLQFDDPFNTKSFHVSCRVVSPRCSSPVMCEPDTDNLDVREKIEAANRLWGVECDNVWSGHVTSDGHVTSGGHVPRDTCDSGISADFHKTVHFAPPSRLTQTKQMCAWRFAYAAARIGPWEEYARDRERFNRRIEEVGCVVSPVLVDGHRAVMRRRLCSD